MNRIDDSILEKVPALADVWQKKNLNGKTFAQLKKESLRASWQSTWYSFVFFISTLSGIFIIIRIAMLLGSNPMSNIFKLVLLLALILGGPVLTWIWFSRQIKRQSLCQNTIQLYTSILDKFQADLNALSPPFAEQGLSHLLTKEMIEARLVELARTLLAAEETFKEIRLNLHKEVETVMVAIHELLQCRGQFDTTWSAYERFGSVENKEYWFKRAMRL